MPQRVSEASLSVGANATSTNRMVGTLAEFIRRRTPYQFAAVAASAGVTCLLIIGESIIINGQALSPNGGAAPFPKEKDDVSSRGIINPGRRVLLTFTNTTGLAVLVGWFLDIA